MDSVKEMTWKERIKASASNKVQKEKEEVATNKLVDLYRKLEQAKKVVKNIENEITDYEMDLE